MGDPKAIPQFGLVAEEVAKIDPDLVARDSEGKPYTVRYEAVNAMLLNEFLKEHRQVAEEKQQNEKQAAAIAELQKEIAILSTTVKEQTAQMHEVNAQLQQAKATAGLITASP